MKSYHAIIVFLFLLIPSLALSRGSYNDTQAYIMSDMNQALKKTISLQASIEITPDTIQNYLANLQIRELKECSFLYYAMESEQYAISSDIFTWNRDGEGCNYQCYANLSPFDILRMSDQRFSSLFLLLSLSWALGSFLYLRRKQDEEVETIGNICMIGDKFYNCHHEPIHLTPMQSQLLTMFFQSESHSLSKQEICDALWPKKPDASNTLYTLIKRLKPVLEEEGNVQITSERGKDYLLK